MKAPAHLQQLVQWFERQKRVLPWRDQPTLYRVWISEIMLQQTQVATVVPYFERFVARFPSVEVLARASEAEVMKLWAGLGYYSRARNLLRGAQAIVTSGDFPRDREGWFEIPGVGDYTAGAILSIALDQPEAILDGNVERVLSRVYRVDRDKGDADFKGGAGAAAAYKEALWERSWEWVRRGSAGGLRPSDLNQAVMELGATVCSVRKPRCEACPVASVCRARKAGVQEEYPPRKKPKKWVSVQEELHCVLDRAGRVLLRQRSKGEWREGLWDLLDSAPSGAVSLGTVESRHVVTRHRVTRVTHVWRLERGRFLRAEEPEAGVRWVSVAEPEVAIGSAVRKVLERVFAEIVTSK